MSGWQSNPVWGQIGPAYKSQKIQGGPGEMRSPNSDWPLEWEAVAGERSGSLKDAPLRYSSSPGGHWPLTWVGSLSGMLNYYWPSAHPGSLGRLGGMLIFDWLSGQPFSSSFSGISCVLAGRKELLEKIPRWRMQG